MGTLRPPRRPVAAAGRQSVTGIARPSRAAMVRCSLSTNPPVWRAAGRLRVRRRARRASVPSGAGTGRIQQILGLPARLSDREDAAAIGQPGDREPDAVERVDPDRRTGTRPRVADGLLPRPAGPPLERRDARQRGHLERLVPLVNHHVHEPGPIGRRQRRHPEAAAGRAVLHRPGREDPAFHPVFRDRHDLEPAVRVAEEEQAAAVREPARPGGPLGVPRDRALLARGEIDDRDLARPQVRPALGGERQPGPVRRPGEVLDVHAGRRDRARLRRDGSGGWAAATRQRRVLQPDLAPAPPTRDEGELPAARSPARRAASGWMVGHHAGPAAVGPDQPDRVVAHVGEVRAVGRPLRVRDGLLRRGQLPGRAAAQLEDEDLPGPSGLGRAGDPPAIRREARLAGRVAGDDLLDREPAGARPGRPRAGAGRTGGWPPAGRGPGDSRTRGHRLRAIRGEGAGRRGTRRRLRTVLRAGRAATTPRRRGGRR